MCKSVLLIIHHKWYCGGLFVGRYVVPFEANFAVETLLEVILHVDHEDFVVRALWSADAGGDGREVELYYLKSKKICKFRGSEIRAESEMRIHSRQWICQNPGGFP